MTSMEDSFDIPGILTSALSLTHKTFSGILPYLAGYSALRYLAAYESTLSPSVYASSSTTSYNTEQTSLAALSSYTGTLWLGSTNGTAYAPTVTTLDASATTGTITLAGNCNCDTIIGGAGTNVIWGGSSAKDTLYLYNGFLKNALISDTDVVLTVADSSGNSGSVTLKDATDRQITLNLEGTIYETICTQTTQSSTVDWSDGINCYCAGDAYSNTLKVSGSTDAFVDLSNTSKTTLYHGFRQIDASTSSGADVLVGSTDSDIIKSGTGSSQIWGGFGGNDSFELGSGTDRVWFGLTDSNDTIMNGTSSDRVFFYDIININNINFSLQGTTLQGTTSNGNSFYIQNWSTTGLNTFETSDNMKYSLNLTYGDLHIVDKN